VPGYSRLVQESLYPGVDWLLYGKDDRFEYDLILHPGARAEHARLRVEGAAAHLNADGSLRAGDILHWRPEAYQWVDGKRVEVTVRLEGRSDGEFAFAVGPHRSDLDLTIDPVIQLLAVAGGSDEDQIVGTATGSSCSYRYGSTRSADWSHVPGSGHAVFAQLTPPNLGTQTVFWGGDGDSQVGGADTDLNNCRPYLAGSTAARNAPVIDGDSLSSRGYAGGATDGFVLEIRVGRACVRDLCGRSGRRSNLRHQKNNADRLFGSAGIGGGDGQLQLAGLGCAAGRSGRPDRCVRRATEFLPSQPAGCGRLRE